jgi:hypothetical protein
VGWGFLGDIAKAAVKFIPGVGPVADTIMDVAGGALSAGSKSMTEGRSNQANTELEKMKLQQLQDKSYFGTMLEKDAAQRTNAGDAWKRLMQTSYVANGGMKSPGLAGQYSRPAPTISPEMRQAAANPELFQALLSRANYTHDPLGGEAPSRMLDTAALDKTAKSGFLEKMLGIGGTVLGGLGAVPKKYETKK